MSSLRGVQRAGDERRGALQAGPPRGADRGAETQSSGRPVLPLPDFFDHSVGDPADQIGADGKPVQLLEMALDLPRRHAAGEPRSVRNLNHLIGVGIVDTPSCKVTAKNALNQQGIPKCLFLL